MDWQSVVTPGNRARGVDAVRDRVRDGGGRVAITSADTRVPTLIEPGRRFQIGSRLRHANNTVFLVRDAPAPITPPPDVAP